MTPFTLHLQAATQTEHIGDVAAFMGEDKSGSFGIWSGHERMMTSLVFGLSRFRAVNGVWQYVAAPGALVYFVNNELFFSTRHYLRDTDFERINGTLNTVLFREEESLRDMKTSLNRMENEMMKRLWQMSRSGGGLQ